MGSSILILGSLSAGMLKRSSSSFFSSSFNRMCCGTRKCSVISTSRSFSEKRSKWKMGSNFLQAYDSRSPANSTCFA